MILICLGLLVSVANAYEIVAHRGVHQTFPREGLKNDTCTATRIYPPTHGFVENTLESIREAYRLGATMVEIDIHPTSDGKMVVFHDWTLDCRTEARCDNGCKCDDPAMCVTHDQPLEFLKSLDLGHGYTADGGKTFPLRGKFIGKMPTLGEALGLLLEFRDKKLLINVKDKLDRTQEGFLEMIQKYPVELRRRVQFQWKPEYRQRFQALEVQEDISQGNNRAKGCWLRYLVTGWVGYVPEICRNTKLFVPIRETLDRLHPWLGSIRGTSVLPGWPHKMIERFEAHGTKLYATQVDSVEEFREMRKLPLHGIMTNRIELLSPHLSTAKP
jgi:glycerophosphoryl diester phosphodiesterase